MLMVMNLKREYTAILENADKVGYEKVENQISDLTFTMPIDDAKNELIQELLWVELTDDKGEYIGLFRIMPSVTEKNKTNQTITYTASHALSTLLDSVLLGYHELVNKKTVDVINYVLSKQKTKHWVLKKCDFTRYFSYAWENENGLADALFSIAKPLNEDYLWTWNTQVYPFELSLVKAPTTPVCRIQEGYNLEGFEIEKDPRNLVNRVYPLGAGEGVNKLNIKSVNNGKDYVEDTQSIKKYGLSEYIWVDERFTNAQALKDNAMAMLKKWSQPKITWKVSAVDLIKLTDTPLTIDKLRVGNVVMINTNEFGSVSLRISKESKSDVFGSPQSLELEINNLNDDITTTLSDLGRKQQINETYSQGATNILNYGYADNCEKAYPAIIEFFIDDDVFHINSVELTFKAKKYRGYTKAVKGGGATVKSTSAGGATTQTSSSGGGSTQTSTSGGGSTQSSTSGGGYSSGSTTNSGGGSTQTSSANGQSTQTSSANGSHRHRMFAKINNNTPVVIGKEKYSANGGIVELNSGTNGELWTDSEADNHSHTVTTPSHSHSVNVPAHSHNFNLNIPTHSHNVTIPNHSHRVTIPNHTHKVTIPNHTHQITLPDHVHPLEWGIYEASTSPSRVDIVVDGKTLSVHDTNVERLNLVEHLKKTTGGKITKGWHKIEIKPNLLARIEAQVICRVFIQSQLGGQY
jgi:phage minor structural protein